MHEDWLYQWRKAVDDRDSKQMAALLANPDSKKLASALVYAGEHDCLEGLHLLLKAGVDPNVQLSNERFAISYIVHMGREKAVQLLLDHGARPDELSTGEWPPLHAAAEQGDAELLRRLLRAGIKVEVGSAWGESALHVAARQGYLEAARVLLDSGCPVDLRRELDKTPLTVAAGAGHVEMVRLLLERGADPNLPSYETPLMAAAGHGREGVAALLLANGADLTARDVRKRTPLHYAVEGDSPALVRLLLEAGAEVDARDCRDHTPLMDAAGPARPKYRKYRKSRELCQVLIDAGADVNAVTSEGCSALKFAAATGDMPRVELLLAAGARVDGASRWGWTPLMVATKARHRNVVRCLLAAGAPPLTWEKRRQLALLEALASNYWRYACLLLTLRLDVNCQDEEGQTPLHLALGARRPNEWAVRKLLAYGAAVNQSDLYEHVPLSRVQAKGFRRFVRLLLDAGADLNSGRVPVGIAMLNEQISNGEVENTEFLIACGVEVNTPDRQGITPLVRAVYSSVRDPSRRILRAVLRAGADMHAVRTDGKTALQLATERADPELLQVFQEFNASGTGAPIEPGLGDTASI